MAGDIELQIDELLKRPLFSASPEARERVLLPLFRQRILEAVESNARYANYVGSWPTPIGHAERLADLPYLPVSVFKSEQPLSCLPAGSKARTVTSSATTGQAPSRIVVDPPTARAMSRGAAAILKDFIGSARRPLLIIDAPQSNDPSVPLTARGAAIRALTPYATRIDPVIRDADLLDLDMEGLRRACDAYGDDPVLVYGFTYVLWLHFAEVLREAGVTLNLSKAHVLHSGGWKKLIAASVEKRAFNLGVAKVVGCDPSRVIDFYGMVENIGVIYPDCEYGNKHVPGFAEVIVRHPLTLAPVEAGQTGIVQVGSLLPTSFPGHMLLTDDVARLEHRDGCECGRRGLAFRLLGRVPSSEVRGCGSVIARRHENNVRLHPAGTARSVVATLSVQGPTSGARP